MDLNIEKALKFQFEDKQWKKKSGVLMIVTGVVFGLYFMTFIGLYVAMLFSVGSSTASSIRDGSFALTFFGFGCLGLISFLLVIFWGSTMAGYNIEVTKMVMKDQDTDLPEVSPILPKMILGLKQIFVHLLPVFVIIMVYVVVAVVGMTLMVSGAGTDGYRSQSSSMLIPLGILVYIFGICIYLCLLMFYAFLIAPAANYLFIKKGLSSMFSYGEMLAIAKKNWLNFLIVAGLAYVGGMVLAFAIYIPIIGWIFYPIGYVILMNAMAHLYGQVYSKIDGIKVSEVEVIAKSRKNHTK